MINKQDVQRIAKLARLGLDPKEIEKFQKELSSILDYIDQLKKVDIVGVKPVSHAIAVENVMREDEVGSLDFGVRKKIIEEFPEMKKGYLKTKSIL